MRILHVVGARPNFMKVSPVLRALQSRGEFDQTLVNTGQHYDENMVQVFFDELDIPLPDVNLEVGSGTHAQQTARIMIQFEETVLEYEPNLVLVYGDVNSTVAAALVCSKVGIPVGHVEAGLRSFDRSMPEEINRVITDRISDILFTPSEDGDINLANEGVSKERVHRVGNVMIDTLVRLLPRAKGRSIRSRLGIADTDPYAVVTLHRPSNVDGDTRLASLMSALGDIAEMVDVVFPVHPRTRRRIDSLAIDAPPRVRLVGPLGYLDFLALQQDAAVVVTDSGGIQEETTYLGVPCLTLRENTERPVTITLGTNTLVGTDPDHLPREVTRVLDGDGEETSIPALWDGRAGERIATVLVDWWGKTA